MQSTIKIEQERKIARYQGELVFFYCINAKNGNAIIQKCSKEGKPELEFEQVPCSEVVCLDIDDYDYLVEMTRCLGQDVSYELNYGGE